MDFLPTLAGFQSGLSGFFLVFSSGFLLGAAIGSFLNVVILRGEEDKPITGRSHCMSCTHKLSALDLVPIFSFLFLRGRCRYCKAKIAWQYPLVELATALSFAGIFIHVMHMSSVAPQNLLFSAAPVLLYGMAASLLILIVVHDLRAKIIPDAYVYAFIALSFMSLFADLQAGAFQMPSMLELSAGPLLFLPFFVLWYFSGGRLIGLGDGKLALGIGWFLGLAQGYTAIILAFWIGAFVSVALLGFMRLHRHSVSVRQTSSARRAHKDTHKEDLLGTSTPLTMKSEVPFAPFLVLGFILAVFFQLNLF